MGLQRRKEIKMKKIISLAVIAVIVVLGIIFIPRLAHTCNACDEFFIGTGYEPNIISDILSDEEQIICKDCAEEQHALAIALGQSLDEFKRDLFE